MNDEKLLRIREEIASNLDKIVEGLNQLKKLSLLTMEMNTEEEVVPQNPPCTINARITKCNTLRVGKTYIKSELKCSKNEGKDSVKIWIEHDDLSWWDVLHKSYIVRVGCSVLITFLITWGCLYFVRVLMCQENRVKIKTVVQGFEGTNLTQKCEVGMKHEWREPRCPKMVK